MKPASAYTWAFAMFGGMMFSGISLLNDSVIAEQAGSSQLSLPPADDSLTLVAGREFAIDSYVHKPLPVVTDIDPRSSIWVADLQRQIKQFYGMASVNIDRFAPPLYIVTANQPTVRVRAARKYQPSWRSPALQQQFEAVPLPDNFQPSAGTDKEAIVYQPSTGKYWEFWVMEKTGSTTVNSAGHKVEEWGAAWGGRIDDLKVNPGYFVPRRDGNKFGTTATGLPLLAGLMTIKEQQQGVINHALHFAIPESRAGSVWAFPAQRSDGRSANQSAIPQGVTFRLPADLNLATIAMDPYAQMIAKAVQSYGMVLRDTSGSVNFYAENPGNRYQIHPYFGPNGILRCPSGTFAWSCAADGNNRLRGFPWDKLQALKAQLND